MPFSTCCGAETNMPEIDICPDCLEHCDWEEEEEEEEEELTEEELEQDRQNEIALEQEQLNKHEN